MPAIRQYLGMSTAHLPEHVINQPGGLNAIDGVIAYDYDYGTWLIVPEEIDVAVEEANGPIPEIEQLWRYAREHDCDIIRLDRDEPENPDLPTYEWPSHPRAATRHDGRDAPPAQPATRVAGAIGAPTIEPAPVSGVAYFIEATVSDALREGDAVDPDQATAVRFGPFPDYVELTYNWLRRGPDGTGIGRFDAEQDVWEIDGMLFSDLAIAAVPAAKAISGSGLWEGERPPSTMRWPKLAY